MNEGEFDIMVLSVKDRMFRLAKTLVSSREEAEDVTQDVLEMLWSKRQGLSRYDNLEAFIYTVVRNRCLDRLRSRKRHAEKREHIRVCSAVSEEPGKALELRDMKARVEQIIAELPGKQRMIIHLRDIEGYETAEIAQITTTDEAAVRMTLSRARKQVREKLTDILNHDKHRSE